MMENFEYYNHHYIRTDSSGNITKGWSDGPLNSRKPTEDDILINDKGGYQFRLIIDGVPTEENPPLFDDLGVPLYHWDGSKITVRLYADVEVDREAIQKAAEEARRKRIENSVETILLDTAADQEERICLLELGIAGNV